MAHPYRSKDGLLSSSDPEAVARWDAMVQAQEMAGASLADQLRAIGVKCAHPDDGWVSGMNPDGSYRKSPPLAERKDGYLSVSWYPLFDDGAEAGDLIALGAHYDGKPYRLCRVTKVEEGTGHIRWKHYYFIDTGETYPPKPPKKSFWKRFSITK
jgi:hypothetical protein